MLLIPLLLLTIGSSAAMKTPKCTHNAYVGTVADLDAGKPLGEPIHEATVGISVVHRWSCDGDELAGVSFRNCYVSDGETHLADVIDQHGCSMDSLLVSNIRRSADQKTTFMETAVFKYANQSELWYFCEAQTCTQGRCDNIMPMPSCFKYIDPSKEQHLLIPSKPLPQPAPTADLDAELDQIMRELNGTYQPALIVSGRLHVRKASVNASQNETTKPVDFTTHANSVVDDEVMEKMTFGRPLTWSGTLVLIVGLGTLITLSACAFFALIYRRFERVIDCGNQKSEYPM
ncbi:unnamed protein product [Bursaphelenchus xylophilus]|uniref:(pine wood nematode) hypothetical protein n=1 Tax=Bursaphelenchus xylophilus TaxID=6326 RepID=A0A1I7SBY7_BURXY|nr:unnamed protein product [Bursaphelenchus xylophilus]CAG9089040.1 unnamed protein product [Bursaphelenchus xylophilus]